MGRPQNLKKSLLFLTLLVLIVETNRFWRHSQKNVTSMIETVIVRKCNYPKNWIRKHKNLTTGFLGKEAWSPPPGFSLQFPKELSYGYLRFEGNGEIP